MPSSHSNAPALSRDQFEHIVALLRADAVDAAIQAVDGAIGEDAGVGDRAVPLEAEQVPGAVAVEREADVGAILGWGFAPWTGGPISMIDGIGLAKFVETADRLAATYGDRFKVPQLLRDMAAAA